MSMQEGDWGSVPGVGKSPGGENGNPHQYSRLGNPTGRGSWQAAVHRVTKSRIRLSNQAHIHRQKQKHKPRRPVGGVTGC